MRRGARCVRRDAGVEVGPRNLRLRVRDGDPGGALLHRGPGRRRAAELKGSIGGGPNHSNNSNHSNHSNSFKIGIVDYCL